MWSCPQREADRSCLSPMVHGAFLPTLLGFFATYEISYSTFASAASMRRGQPEGFWEAQCSALNAALAALDQPIDFTVSQDAFTAGEGRMLSLAAS